MRDNKNKRAAVIHFISRDTGHRSFFHTLHQQMRFAKEIIKICVCLVLFEPENIIKGVCVHVIVMNSYYKIRWRTSTVYVLFWVFSLIIISHFYIWPLEFCQSEAGIFWQRLLLTRLNRQISWYRKFDSIFFVLEFFPSCRRRRRYGG